jgi:hypothetical protein
MQGRTLAVVPYYGRRKAVPLPRIIEKIPLGQVTGLLEALDFAQRSRAFSFRNAFRNDFETAAG